MPMGATYSVVISAACHQPLPDDRDAYKFPVQWGAISHPDVIHSPTGTSTLNIGDTGEVESNNSTSTGDDVCTTDPTNGGEVEGKSSNSGRAVRPIVPGHCCFTTARDVEPPRERQIYA